MKLYSLRGGGGESFVSNGAGQWRRAKLMLCQHQPICLSAAANLNSLPQTGKMLIEPWNSSDAFSTLEIMILSPPVKILLLDKLFFLS